MSADPTPTAGEQNTTDPLTEAIRAALGEVLWNASNYPRRAQPFMLGQDTAPLRDKATEAVAAVVRASGTTTPRGSCPEHGLTYCAECGWVLPGETTRELAALRAELEAIRTTIQPMTTVAAAWLDTRLNDALNGPR